jgi:hypothetical protein
MLKYDLLKIKLPAAHWTTVVSNALIEQATLAEA